jgi:two-component sensor histidine kinase
MKKGRQLYKIEDLKPGKHLCCIYETDEEHKSVITPYLRLGLENNEKVLYIVDENTAETVLNYLKDDGVDADQFLHNGQLSILNVTDSYMKDGVFDPDKMIKMLSDETGKALKEGYNALRVTGEMSWTLRGFPGSERLIEYEAKLNNFFPKNECLAICQYDARIFDPEILMEILETHPLAIIGTEIYENFYYIPPHEFLSGKTPEKILEHWKKNLQLRKEIKTSLAEKEILLKEIHHRVKNNLMIIYSLLNLQAGYLEDEKSREIFKESQSRARSMALIHERLYLSTDLKLIDFGDYLQTLSAELLHTYATQKEIIELEMNVENIKMDINHAIPLGLISNELITNCFKHAFPNGRNGKVQIDLRKNGGLCEMIVRDNGVGFPEEIDFRNTNSLGLQMINSLTKQIDGSIDLDNNPGTEFKITFKDSNR